jgi:mannose-6-phosphate isomerase-like protein (cupin superfamily)
MFKIMKLGETPVEPMDGGRGEKLKLVNTTLGTHNVDVHLNRLKPGGPRGKVHRHSKADNVYIVRRGEGTFTVGDATHIVREDDVIFIPAGMKHSLSNLGDSEFEIFEIYAPAGKDFDFVLEE